ncbi:MAG: DNA repair protein RadC [Planctomycetota bacterium]|nr:DNA repair protein RadC [Planctomycetota bacterium]
MDPIQEAGSALRERALGRGGEALETHEWLALLLGPRVPPRRARELLADCDLLELARLPGAELVARFGLGPAAAARVAAAFGLGRRLERARLPRRASMKSPRRVYEEVAADLRGLDRERFLTLVLDGKHRLKRTERVSEGTLTTSLVHPREVFRPAVRESAAALIVVHNHPSGDPEPSAEDLEVTRRLIQSGKLIGIPLLDHVVVGDGRFVSLRERMEF